MNGSSWGDTFDGAVRVLWPTVLIVTWWLVVLGGAVSLIVLLVGELVKRGGWETRQRHRILGDIEVLNALPESLREGYQASILTDKIESALTDLAWGPSTKRTPGRSKIRLPVLGKMVANRNLARLVTVGGTVLGLVAVFVLAANAPDPWRSRSVLAVAVFAPAISGLLGWLIELRVATESQRRRGDGA